MESVIDGAGEISDSGGFDYCCQISIVSKDSGDDGDEEQNDAARDS